MKMHFQKLSYRLDGEKGKEDMEAKRFGNWIVLWEVYECDDTDAEIRKALFKNPNKAADYALSNNCLGGVRMSLFKPDWPVKTMD